MEEAVRLIKRDSRRYAKRQLTWFGGEPGIRWVDLDAAAAVHDTVDQVMTCLEDAHALEAQLQ
jgi:tRNA dimethylallyltransferase